MGILGNTPVSFFTGHDPDSSERLVANDRTAKYRFLHLCSCSIHSRGCFVHAYSPSLTQDKPDLAEAEMQSGAFLNL
jgi:hypothetical protein